MNNGELLQEDLVFFNELIGKKVYVINRASKFIGTNNYTLVLKSIGKKFLKFLNGDGKVIIMSIEDISYIESID